MMYLHRVEYSLLDLLYNLYERNFTEISYMVQYLKAVDGKIWAKLRKPRFEKKKKNN